MSRLLKNPFKKDGNFRQTSLDSYFKTVKPHFFVDQKPVLINSPCLWKTKMSNPKKTTSKQKRINKQDEKSKKKIKHKIKSKPIDSDSDVEFVEEYRPNNLVETTSDAVKSKQDNDSSDEAASFAYLDQVCTTFDLNNASNNMMQVTRTPQLSRSNECFKPEILRRFQSGDLRPNPYANNDQTATKASRLNENNEYLKPEILQMIQSDDVSSNCNTNRTNGDQPIENHEEDLLATSSQIEFIESMNETLKLRDDFFQSIEDETVSFDQTVNFQQLDNILENLQQLEANYFFKRKSPPNNTDLDQSSPRKQIKFNNDSLDSTENTFNRIHLNSAPFIKSTKICSLDSTENKRHRNDFNTAISTKAIEIGNESLDAIENTINKTFISNTACATRTKTDNNLLGSTESRRNPNILSCTKLIDIENESLDSTENATSRIDLNASSSTRRIKEKDSLLDSSNQFDLKNNLLRSTETLRNRSDLDGLSSKIRINMGNNSLDSSGDLNASTSTKQINFNPKSSDFAANLTNCIDTDETSIDYFDSEFNEAILNKNKEIAINEDSNSIDFFEPSNLILVIGSSTYSQETVAPSYTQSNQTNETHVIQSHVTVQNCAPITIQNDTTAPIIYNQEAVAPSFNQSNQSNASHVIASPVTVQNDASYENIPNIQINPLKTINSDNVTSSFTPSSKKISKLSLKCKQPISKTLSIANETLVSENCATVESTIEAVDKNESNLIGNDLSSTLTNSKQKSPLQEQNSKAESKNINEIIMSRLAKKSTKNCNDDKVNSKSEINQNAESSSAKYLDDVCREIDKNFGMFVKQNSIKCENNQEEVSTINVENEQDLLIVNEPMISGADNNDLIYDLNADQDLPIATEPMTSELDNNDPIFNLTEDQQEIPIFDLTEMMVRKLNSDPSNSLNINCENSNPHLNVTDGCTLLNNSQQFFVAPTINRTCNNEAQSNVTIENDILSRSNHIQLPLYLENSPDPNSTNNLDSNCHIDVNSLTNASTQSYEQKLTGADFQFLDDDFTESNTPTPGGPDGLVYNLKTTRSIMLYVANNSELFDVLFEWEKKMLWNFFMLPVLYQFVCFRLFTRSSKWYERSGFVSSLGLTMTFQEIDDLFNELWKKDFVLTDYSREPPKLLLNQLQFKDLVVIHKKLSIKFKSNSRKELMIDNILSYCSKQTTLTKTNLHMILIGCISVHMGQCVKLNYKFRDCLFKMQLLYSFAASTDLVSTYDLYLYVNDKLRNKDNYPEFTVDHIRIFKTAKEFGEYAAAKECYNQYILNKERKRMQCVQEIAEVSAIQLKIIIDNCAFNDEHLPQKLRRFTAGYLYARILYLACEDMTRNFTLVMNWLELLLSQNKYCLHKRGELYDRLSMYNQKYYKYYNKACQVLIDGLSDKYVSKLDQNKLSCRIKSLKSKSDPILFKKVMELQVDLFGNDEIFQRVIDAKAIRSNYVGQKRTYIIQNEMGEKSYVSVEDVALDYYSKTGFYGIHCEGRIIQTLFFLLYWDIIYSTVPHVFISELQTMPLDFRSPEFYLNRRSILDARTEQLVLLNEEELDKFLRAAHESYGTKFLNAIDRNPYVQLGADFLCDIVKCISYKTLSLIFIRLLGDYGAYHAGMPDLMLWNIAQKTSLFVEVKGERDTLSLKQKLWLKYLREAGANVEVCLVHITDTPGEFSTEPPDLNLPLDQPDYVITTSLLPTQSPPSLGPFPVPSPSSSPQSTASAHLNQQSISLNSLLTQTSPPSTVLSTEDLTSGGRRQRATETHPPSSAADLPCIEKLDQLMEHQYPDCGKNYSTLETLNLHRHFDCLASGGPRTSYNCKYSDKVTDAPRLSIKAEDLNLSGGHITITDPPSSGPLPRSALTSLSPQPSPSDHLNQHSLSPNSSSLPSTTLLAEDLMSIEERPPETSTAHPCPDCGRICSTSNYLTEHRRRHCIARPRKSYSCKYCEKEGFSLSAFQKHIRTHTLQHKCNFCGKAFSSSWLLNCHIRTHTEERPIACTFCSLSFADLSNWRDHLSSHLDTQFFCPQCSKGFRKKFYLTRHIKRGCHYGTQ